MVELPIAGLSPTTPHPDVAAKIPSVMLAMRDCGWHVEHALYAAFPSGTWCHSRIAAPDLGLVECAHLIFIPLSRACFMTKS